MQTDKTCVDGRQADSQTCRQTNNPTDRQTDVLAESQTDRQV